eukprot:IDg10148t1
MERDARFLEAFGWERAATLFLSFAIGKILYEVVEKQGMAQRKVSSPCSYIAAYIVGLLGFAAAFMLLGNHLQDLITSNRRESYAVLEKGKLRSKLYGGVPASKIVQLAQWTHTTRSIRLSMKKVSNYGSSWMYKGKKGGPRVFVIGDSHAGHLRSVGVLLNKRFGASVYYRVGPSCPPLFFVHKVFLFLEKSEAGCAKMVKEWRTRLKNERFDAVVLAARWTNLIHYGGPDYLIPLNETKEIADENGKKALYKRSTDLLEPSLKDTVMDVVKYAKNVVVISQVTILRAHPKICKKEPSCASHERMAGKNRTAFVDEAVVRALHGSSRAQAMLPGKYLCDDAHEEPIPGGNSKLRCLSSIGQEPLYMDSNHLTDLGSAYLARKWEKDNFGKIKWKL